MVQLHGDEGPSYCGEVGAAHRREGHQGGRGCATGRRRRRLQRLPRRLPPARRARAGAARAAPARPSTGTGRALAARGVPLILARRPDARERRRAIAAVRPWAVDVASGVEARPASRTRARSRAFTSPRRGASRAVAAVTELLTPCASSAGVEHRFGPYGGQYVPETLMPALARARGAWIAARDDAGFRAELDALLRDYAGRPTPLYLRRAARRASPGARIYLKREDLLHTGAHKINNALGQALLARRMGKKRIIAETGAGQHGVATRDGVRAARARVRRLHGRARTCARQALNVDRMQLLGREGRAGRGRQRARSRRRHQRGDPRLGDQRRTTHYISARCVGPAPVPALVRDLQRVIGDEARAPAPRARRAGCPTA